ncbi:MAG: DUF3618 domain-containing protein [Candidatus Nanopelagicales bacterium]
MSDNETSKSRTPEEIAADMEATRQRLAENLEQLKAETTPQALAAKARAKVTGVFVDPATGEVRRERVAAVVGVVVGVVILRKGIKARARRRELKRLSQVVWVPVPRASVNPEYAAMARDARELAALPSAG